MHLTEECTQENLVSGRVSRGHIVSHSYWPIFLRVGAPAQIVEATDHSCSAETP